MFQTVIVENITTHILCSVPIFENRAVYEITWNFFDEECKKFLKFKLTSKFNRIYPVVFYLLLTSKYWD